MAAELTVRLDRESLEALARRVAELLDERGTPAPAPDHDSAALLTVANVAERLAVTAKTVRQLIHAGELRAATVAGRLRIEPAELDAFLARRAVAPAGRTPELPGRAKAKAGVMGAAVANLGARRKLDGTRGGA